MKYLYKGSTEELCIDSSDILELMAAANFFQLDGLLHYCEIRCAELINPETIVSYYIHAKVTRAIIYRVSVSIKIMFRSTLPNTCWFSVKVLFFKILWICSPSMIPSKDLYSGKSSKIMM